MIPTFEEKIKKIPYGFLYFFWPQNGRPDRELKNDTMTPHIISQETKLSPHHNKIEANKLLKRSLRSCHYIFDPNQNSTDKELISSQ